MDIYQTRERIAATDPDYVLLVRMFGLPEPVDTWAEVCRAGDMVLIEDCERALDSVRPSAGHSSRVSATARSIPYKKSHPS